jgi:hypothetical protein
MSVLGIVASRECRSRECRSRDGRSRNGRSRNGRCIKNIYVPELSYPTPKKKYM